MEIKKNGFKFINEAGNKASDALEKVKIKASKAADQNGDGEFDAKDAAIIAENLKNSAKKSLDSARDGIERKAREIELKMLQPIFVDNLDSADFFLPKFLRIVEYDKKHAESSACKDSIGFFTDLKDYKLLTVYRSKLDLLGITTYPDAESEYYYVNPTNRDNYIALDEYFGFLKSARVNELQRIAQELGASHFKVTFKEEKSSFTETKARANAEVKKAGEASAMHEREEKKYAAVEIAAEMMCNPHEPHRPDLVYLQRDPSIQSLVEMRMNRESSLHHQTYEIKLSSTSGIKENDAIKIDTALSAMKCKGNASFSNEVRNDMRRYFYYEIDF